jgi:hypothetical protein
MAAANQVVGFGAREAPNATVHTRTSPARNPDLYPLNLGVVSITSYPGRYPPNSSGRRMYSGLVAALREALN